MVSSNMNIPTDSSLGRMLCSALFGCHEDEEERGRILNHCATREAPAFAFLYETTGFLRGISEVSYCQQLLSIFNFLELQVQSLLSTEGPAVEVIHATFSLFQYVSQLVNGSAEALLGSERFVLDNKSVSSMNYSIDEGSSSILPWAQILSNLSANGSEFHGFTAVHCTISWLQMWAQICGRLAQIFQLDTNVFTPLRVGLMQILAALESDVKIPQSCQGIFPDVENK
ncbi:ATP-binding cassette sub-family A member 13-like [Delphinus delphis]|uniref:ATP-binding cassette sub-family A member 13-like n=1 Tax=Delphinus delphis TaxID=9728 RepID=UPI0037518A4D